MALLSLIFKMINYWPNQIYLNKLSNVIKNYSEYLNVNYSGLDLFFI